MTVRIEIGIDTVMPERLALFWADALGYAVGDFDVANTYLDLVPPATGLPVVYLQRVPEPKTVKNRLHLDLMATNPEELIGRLASLGATRIGAPMSGSEGGWWQVMADPEGNEFCVCRDD
ncbi:MAG: VOC family protein [Acidimicrobiales bacterium]|jgi:predicted enzyme related to lactoylglutathione lyase